MTTWDVPLLVIRIHSVEWNWRQAFYEHARTSPRVVGMGLLCVDLYLTTLPHCSHLASSRCNHRGSHPRRQPWPDLWDSRSVYSTDARFRSPSFSRPSSLFLPPSSLLPQLRQLASVSTNAEFPCTRRDVLARGASGILAACFVHFRPFVPFAHSRKAGTYFGRNAICIESSVLISWATDSRFTRTRHNCFGILSIYTQVNMHRKCNCLSVEIINAHSLSTTSTKRNNVLLLAKHLKDFYNTLQY